MHVLAMLTPTMSRASEIALNSSTEMTDSEGRQVIWWPIPEMIILVKKLHARVLTSGQMNKPARACLELYL